jgi:hypothetical protein
MHMFNIFQFPEKEGVVWDGSQVTAAVADEDGWRWQRNLLENFLQTNSFDRTIKSGQIEILGKNNAAGSSDRCKLSVSGVSRCTGFLLCFARHGLCVDGMTV